MNARDFRSRDGCRSFRTTKAKAPSIARGFEILEHRLRDTSMICRIHRLSARLTGRQKQKPRDSLGACSGYWTMPVTPMLSVATSMSTRICRIRVT